VKFIFLFLFVSCSGHLLNGGPRQGKMTYSYLDSGGRFSYLRDLKLVDNKIITRNQIINPKGSETQVLEKSIMVSRIGSIQHSKIRLLTVRPEASEYIVWLEGKRYVSRMQLNPKKKNFSIELEGPETRWQGTREEVFPKGKYFCFFGQLPECLYHNSLLKNALSNKTRRLDFYVIWESYPFVQDILMKIGNKLFAPATVKFDGEIQGLLRYVVEVEGQVVLYQFTKTFELVKVAWISQGITIAPPGEEIAEDD
jgi:hypothetical protein